MWLYFISTLSICNAQILTISIPYPLLLTYQPGYGPIKDRNSMNQGGLFYLGNSKIEQVQIGKNPDSQAFQQDVSSEVIKAQESHFLAWSLQQYQMLKHEIDLLRAEGKEPDPKTILRFIPLEKIALTSDYSKIAELPEVKRIREEHLNIWKHLQQLQEDKINMETEKYSTQVDRFHTKQASKRQISEIKQMELIQDGKDKVNNLQPLTKDKQDVNHQEYDPSKLKPNQSYGLSEKSLSLNQDYQAFGLPQQVLDTSEVIKARKEHLRLVKETREIIEGQRQIKSKQNELISLETKSAKENDAFYSNSPQQIAAIIRPRALLEDVQVINESESKLQTSEGDLEQLKTNLKDTNDPTLESPQVPDLSEITKAHEDNLSLEIKAQPKLSVQKKVKSEVEELIAKAPMIYVPQGVVDTDEVIRARNEHLRIVSEAIRKIKLAQALEQQKDDINTD